MNAIINKIENRFYVYQKKKINNAIYFVSTGDVLRGDEIIKKILYSVFSEISPRLRSEIIFLISKVYSSKNSKKLYIELNECINNKIKTIPAEKVSPKKWLLFNYILIRIGLFFASVAARKQSILSSYVMAELKNDACMLMEAFKASVDCCDFSQAQKFAYYIEERDFYLAQKAFDYLKFFDPSFSNTCGGVGDIVSQRYCKWVNRKSVALVGPAPTCDNGKEIDAYDLVSRLNYFDNVDDVKKFGSKTDMSYYGGSFYDIFFHREYFNVLKKINFASFKNDKFKKNKFLKNFENLRKFEYNDMYFSGSPTMMECAVYDILKNNPGKVKLFNMNFYLSKTTHYDNYHINTKMFEEFFSKKNIKSCGLGNEKINSLSYGVAHHDRLSQLSFIKNLYLSRRIELDAVCKKVVMMPFEQYMMCLQDLIIIPGLD